MKEMNRKEFLKLAVKGTAAAAVLSALPSTLTAYADEGEKLYIPGTYSAEAPGKEKVIVTMTFDETKITDVQVDVSAETPEIGGIHGETLRAQLLEKQSADIDGVTGATMTSNGVKEAAANCIRQALGLEIEEKEETAVTGDSIDALLAESAVVKEPIASFDDEKTYDVVVVGAGTTGLPAAIKAFEEGASVCVLQKSGAAVAQGMCCAAVIPEKSTPAGMSAFLHELHATYDYRTDLALNRVYVQRSGEAVDWYLNHLNEIGFENMMEKETLDHQYEEGNCYLRGTLFPGSMLEPTTALAEYAEKLGIDFYYETPAVQLVADGGKVSGVIGRAKNGSHICFHANKGVILATGDYQNNAAMVARYCPDAALFEKKQFAKTGDGQLMGMLIGAELEPITHTKMIHAKATSVMREEPLLAVNDNGERFVAEDVPYGQRNTCVAYEPNGCWNTIFDANYHDQVVGWGGDPDRSTVGNASPEQIKKFIDNGNVLVADTLEELCEKMGLPVETTVATVKHYNELCKAGFDEDFGKPAKYMKPVDTAPFYGTKRYFQVSALLGGLVTDANGQVKAAGGALIDGLFAAGNCSGPFYGGIDYSLFTMGMSLGRCVTGGYVTGEYVAKL